MASPAFVLLHGAWHSPKCWSQLIPQLEKAGYTAVAPSLPSTGSIPSTPDWSGDIDVIRQTVSKLVEKQDVVVAHSFSGMTAGTALQGFDKQSCLAKGLKGSVIRLVYIAAFLVPERFQHSPHGTRDRMVSEMKTNFEEGTVRVLPEDAKKMFYQDVDDETAADLIEDLRPHSLGSYWSTTDYAAWRDIPTTYVLGLKDMPTTVATARHLIDAAKASGSHKIDRVIEVDAGHSPFISIPEETAEKLIEEANRTTEAP
ncbi:Alpha/beta hydrolase fold-1 [Nemania sp. FL0031]|nr:Alpha/beta hydrolase fold-1 [Nemania sp. FL0031]